MGNSFGEAHQSAKVASRKKLKGARPHMLYQNTFYKGLDVSL